MVIGDDALNEDKLRIGWRRGPNRIMLGYEVGFGNCAIDLHIVNIIAAQVLIQSPVSLVGSIRDVQELRANMTHWQWANSICRFFGDPANRMLSYADSTATWILFNQWDFWHCLRSIIFAMRSIAAMGDDWVNLLSVHLE